MALWADAERDLRLIRVPGLPAGGALGGGSETECSLASTEGDGHIDDRLISLVALVTRICALLPLIGWCTDRSPGDTLR